MPVPDSNLFNNLTEKTLINRLVTKGAITPEDAKYLKQHKNGIAYHALTNVYINDLVIAGDLTYDEIRNFNITTLLVLKDSAIQNLIDSHALTTHDALNLNLTQVERLRQQNVYEMLLHGNATIAEAVNVPVSYIQDNGAVNSQQDPHYRAGCGYSSAPSKKQHLGR